MNSHMPRCEREVMDLWDEGRLGGAGIAAVLGETEERVMQIVARYAGGVGGPEHDRLTRNALIAANATYVAAVAATGRCFT